MENPVRVYQLLKMAGLSQAAIAGIMGNIDVESGFNPAAYNAREGAIGIAQWEGGRRTALQQFAASHGTTETDLDTQVAFLLTEANQRGNLAAMQGYSDPAQAAAYWDANYEVSSGSARQQRESVAQQVYQVIAGPAYGSSASVAGGNVFASLKNTPVADMGSIASGLKNLFLFPMHVGNSIGGAISGGVHTASSIADIIPNLFTMTSFMVNPANWWRIGGGVLGSALILFAAIKVSGLEEPAKQAAVAGVKAAALA